MIDEKYKDCHELIVSYERRTEAEVEEAKRLGGFNIVIVDSCEYFIKMKQLTIVDFAHKDNCRFCKEHK